MSFPLITIRAAQASDLDEINRIISSCVMNWDLPERVKRLSMGSYKYNADDLVHLDIFVAESVIGKVVGLAAFEAANASDLPDLKEGLLLHGLYVDPELQKKGIGKALVEYSVSEVRKRSLDGLLVKAQVDANSYFENQGFEKLPVNNPAKDYPHRWWKSL